MLNLNGESVFLEVGKYVHNDSLAILIIDNDGQQYADMTTCLGEIPKTNCAFVDTNNLGNQIIRWIIENNLGEPTGNFCSSGFCFYPEVKFDMTEVNKYLA